MAEQPTLAGFEPGPPTCSLFFALLPDEAARGRLAELSDALHADQAVRASAVKAGNYHVTLQFLGMHDADHDDDVVAAARRVADPVRMAPFHIAFDSASTFHGRPGHHPFVLRGGAGVEGVARLQLRLYEALRAEPVLRDHAKADGTPHLTLSYAKAMQAPSAIAPIGWRADGFALVRSLIGHGRHEVLGRWPLRD